jgi:hypothetical protein
MRVFRTGWYDGWFKRKPSRRIRQSRGAGTGCEHRLEVLKLSFRDRGYFTASFNALDVDLFTGLGVSAFSGFSFRRLEGAEPHQGYGIVVGKRICDCLNHAVNGLLGIFFTFQYFSNLVD